MRVVSYGGGVQSTALLVLAAQRKIDFLVFLFANVGNDSENPATLAYVRDVAMPYAAAHGIDLAVLDKRRRDGCTETLLEWTIRSERSIRLPLRSADGRPGRRSCTAEFKIDVLGRWLRDQGATRDDPATVALGISIDEFQRMSTDDPRRPWERKCYPLIKRHLSRQDCQNIIAAAGLPIPPKSSCWFCPFHRLSDWQRLKREQPALFEQAVALEAELGERSVRIGREPVWLTSAGRPLDQVVGDQSVMEFEGVACESGYCMV